MARCQRPRHRRCLRRLGPEHQPQPGHSRPADQDAGPDQRPRRPAPRGADRHRRQRGPQHRGSRAPGSRRGRRPSRRGRGSRSRTCHGLRRRRSARYRLITNPTPSVATSKAALVGRGGPRQISPGTPPVPTNGVLVCQAIRKYDNENILFDQSRMFQAKLGSLRSQRLRIPFEFAPPPPSPRSRINL